MTRMNVALARGVMRIAKAFGFGGAGAGFGSTPGQLDNIDPEVRFRQPLFERRGIGDFYRCFPDLDAVIAGKDVLDFGAGYGGKAIEYARLARSVAGTEPFENHIDIAQRFAEHTGTRNVQFRLCTKDTIPWPEASFDVVLSHDVIEHVDDPEVSLREIHRVLRPGGVALLAFPPYDGLLSHHLDYICRLPGIHRLFAPETLVEAVNLELTRRGLPMSRQPAPRLSWDGTREVLPTLNGLTMRQADALLEACFAHVEKGARMIGSGRWPWSTPITRMLGWESLRGTLIYRAHKSDHSQSTSVIHHKANRLGGAQGRTFNPPSMRACDGQPGAEKTAHLPEIESDSEKFRREVSIAPSDPLPLCSRTRQSPAQEKRGGIPKQ